MNGVDIERLGPAAREQVLKELARRERLAKAERRRLFIELIARPRGWVFTEYIEKAEKE